MTLPLSWTESKHRKHGKASVNYQTTQAVRHLMKEHSDTEDTAATIALSKSKFVRSDKTGAT